MDFWTGFEKKADFLHLFRGKERPPREAEFAKAYKISRDKSDEDDAHFDSLPEHEQDMIVDAANHGSRLSRPHFKHTEESQGQHLAAQHRAGKGSIKQLTTAHKGHVEDWLKQYKDKAQDAGWDNGPAGFHKHNILGS